LPCPIRLTDVETSKTPDVDVPPRRWADSEPNNVQIGPNDNDEEVVRHHVFFVSRAAELAALVRLKLYYGTHSTMSLYGDAAVAETFERK
jgi:hypothetical protein